MMMTKKKATDCLDEERNTHSLVSTDDLLHDLDQPAAEDQIIFDNLNVHYIGASEDPRKNNDSAESEVLGDVHADVIQRTTNNGLTPLHMAAQNGNLDVVRYLAGEAHADVNQGRTDNGCTPLHIAAQNGNLDIVRYLAGEAHADVNQGRADNGYAPLHIAALVGNLGEVLGEIICFQSDEQTDPGVLEQSLSRLARFAIGDTETLLKGQSFARVKAQSFARMVIAKLEMQRRFESIATLHRFGRIIAQRQCIRATLNLVKAQSFARMVIAKSEMQRRSESVATLQRFGRFIARRQLKSFTQLILLTIGARTDDEEAFDIKVVEAAVQKDVSERIHSLQSIMQRMFSERLDGQTAYYTKIDSEIRRHKSKLDVLEQALDDYLPLGSDNNYFEDPANMEAMSFPGILRRGKFLDAVTHSSHDCPAHASVTKDLILEAANELAARADNADIFKKQNITPDKFLEAVARIV